MKDPRTDPRSLPQARDAGSGRTDAFQAGDPHILIVDDSPVDRRVYSLQLQQGIPFPLRVSEACDGRSGIRMTRELAPDVVLVDYELPDMTGLDVLEELRAEGLDHEAEVIFLTGTGEKSVVLRAMHMGARDFLEKTELEAEIFVHTVRRAFERSRTARSLRRSEERFRMIAETVPGVFWVSTMDGSRLTYISPSFERTWRRKPPEASRGIEGWLECVHEPDRERVRRALLAGLSGEPYDVEYRTLSEQGDVIWLHDRGALSVDEQGRRSFASFTADMTEHKNLVDSLNQAQKLESVGRLAAGVAHEINTPIQYISDNVQFLSDSYQDLIHLIRCTRERLEPASEELTAAFDELCRAADLEFIEEEVPRSLDQTRDGIDRVSKIVRATKEFSHPGEQSKTSTDLNHSLESTIIVASNEWKYVAEVELDLDPDLPEIPAVAGELNQAFLNLVVNAAHAIGDKVDTSVGEKGVISISTRTVGDHVEVRIGDSGTGIPEAVRPHVLEPFFTTKEVGKGTGQGLSLAYRVVTQLHEGEFEFETEVGVGTTFILRIPIGLDEADTQGCEKLAS